MERFEKIINGLQSLTIIAKRFIWDVWQGSENASGDCQIIHPVNYLDCHLVNYLEVSIQEGFSKFSSGC